jgi:hypothetical protein
MKEKKYIAFYKKKGKKRQVTFTSTDRGMAFVGLLWHGIEMKDIISIKRKIKKP